MTNVEKMKWLKTARLLLIAVCFSSVFSHVNATEAEVNDAVANNRSAGCGAVLQGAVLQGAVLQDKVLQDKAQQGTGNFMPFTTQVLDKTRKYYLRLPSNYDANRVYPLIFRWHGAGGDGLSGGLNIEYSTKDDAIIVSADGLNNFWQIYSGSIDLHFFDNMLETISSQYCINTNRVFSYGFSAGGSFSNLLACERGEVLRANAAIASGLLSSNCKGQVATWLLHDVNDDAVPIAMGKAVRYRVITANGCSTDTIDEGNGCVRYQGCDVAPVVWCETTGFGHNIRGDFAPAQVWQFFQKFE